MRQFVSGLALAAILMGAMGCAVDSGSTLKVDPYPPTAKKAAIFVEAVKGSDADTMRQMLLEELIASNSFTLAQKAEGAAMVVKVTYKEQTDSSGGSGGVSLEGIGVDLGHKTAKWTLQMSVEETAVKPGTTPFLRTVYDEVSTTAVGGGVGYEGENVSSSAAPDTPEVRTARRNVCHQTVYHLILHLKAQGRL